MATTARSPVPRLRQGPRTRRTAAARRRRGAVGVLLLARVYGCPGEPGARTEGEAHRHGQDHGGTPGADHAGMVAAPAEAHGRGRRRRRGWDRCRALDSG